jgi:glyoxylase I family protein
LDVAGWPAVRPQFRVAGDSHGQKDPLLYFPETRATEWEDGIVNSILDELYVDHLVFRVRELQATRAFYSALFGAPVAQSENSLMYQVADTKLFFTLATEKIIAPYDKEQPGLNHLAFGVRTAALLREVLNHLNRAGLRHSGIKIDHYGNKEFIWLDDPDGFRLEFYCRPV